MQTLFSKKVVRLQGSTGNPMLMLMKIPILVNILVFMKMIVIPVKKIVFIFTINLKPCDALTILL